VDLVFHPKFTVPLLVPCKAVMVVHGADWFIPEQAQFYGRLDVWYIKTVMPLYFKKASVVISVSQLTTDNFNRILKLRPGKVKTVYFGPAKHFKRVEDLSVLRAVKSRHNLPDKFILTLSKYSGGDRKNIGNILQAYEIYHGKTELPHKLVVGGRDCDRFRVDYDIPSDGYGGDILFPGWIDQEDLPAFYSMADLYLYPSNLEAFPIPITEAMACGTPIVTSNVNGLKEIAGDAALLVSPDDASEIAGAICQVLTDASLRESLSARGLARSKNFSWDKCARETRTILNSCARMG
jgi:glycosyltransferase involved in cell wall biosynthesis